MSDLDVKMHFTYDAYGGLVETLLTNGYKIATYDNWNNIDKPVILRHDIDTSIEKAVEMAAFENKIGVTSTYFVLLTSDFYNICSRKSQE